MTGIIWQDEYFIIQNKIMIRKYAYKLLRLVDSRYNGIDVGEASKILNIDNNTMEIVISTLVAKEYIMRTFLKNEPDSYKAVLGIKNKGRSIHNKFLFYYLDYKDAIVIIASILSFIATIISIIITCKVH